MHAEPPSIAIGADHFRLARQIRFAILYVSLARLRLKITTKTYAIGRVQVDHLDLAGEILALRQAGHHLQAVAQDQPVRSINIVLVKLDSLRISQLGVGKQITGNILPCRGPQDGLSAHALMNVQRNRVHREARRLTLARPFQPGLMAPKRLGQ